MLTVVTLLFLTGLFEKLPEATLAAVVVAAVIELVDIASLKRLWRVRTGRLASVYRVTSRVDFFAAAATLAGRPPLRDPARPGHRHRDVPGAADRPDRPDRTPRSWSLSPSLSDAPVHAGPDLGRHRTQPRPSRGSRLLVVRVEAPLLFTNADVVREQIRALVTTATPRPDLVVLDGRTTPSIDVTAAAMLVQLRQDLRRLGTELVMADNVGQVRDILEVAEPEDEPPIFVTIDDAIAAASQSRTRRDRWCRSDPRRTRLEVAAG